MSATNLLALSRVRIFRLRSLKFFFINVVLISAVFTAVSSFLLGIQQDEIFLGEAENILVITQESSSTPITGSVSTYLVDDLLKLGGVQQVSAENLDVCVMEKGGDQIVVVRGISNDFQEIEPQFKMVQGNWFAWTNSSKVGEAVAGQTLARIHNIRVGDKILLRGSVGKEIIQVRIGGIVETGTPADEELLVPLWMGRVLSNKPKDSVTIIRVKFDPEITSEGKIRSILNSQYKVTVTVDSSNEATLNLAGVPVNAYSRTHKLLRTIKLSKDNNKIEFSLPFGTYFLSVKHPATGEETVKEIFVDSDLQTNLLMESHFLKFQALLNGFPAKGANITLNEINTGKIVTGKVDDRGEALFELSSGVYRANTQFEKLYNTTSFTLNQSQTFITNLNLYTEVILRNGSTGEPLQGANVTLFLSSNNSIKVSKISDVEGYVLLFPPGYGGIGNYTLEIVYGNHTREQFIALETPENITVYLGKVPIWISAINNSQTSVPNAQIEITAYNDTFKEGASTDFEGKAEFHLETGKKYRVIGKSPSSENYHSFNFSLEEKQNFTLNLGKYHLTAEVWNITSQKPIPYITVYVVDNSSRSVQITRTNASGQASFLLDYGLKRFIIKQKNNQTIYHANFTPWETFVRVPLGGFNLNDTLGANFITTPGNETLQVITADSFKGEVLENASVQLQNSTWSRTESIIGESPVRFQEARFGEYNLSVYLEGIPFNISIEYFRNRTQFTLLLSKLEIEVRNGTNPLEFIPASVLITSSDGPSRIFNAPTNGSHQFYLPSGTYSIQASHKNEQKIEFANLNTSSNNLTIYLGKLLLRVSCYLSPYNIPMANISVQAQTNSSIEVGITDSLGTVDFLLSQGQYKLNFTYWSSIVTKNITLNTPTNLTEVFYFSGILEIDVRDKNGLAIPNATVTLILPFGNSFRTKITDWKGVTNFGRVPWGNYTVQIFFEGDVVFSEIITFFKTGNFEKTYYLQGFGTSDSNSGLIDDKTPWPGFRKYSIEDVGKYVDKYMTRMFLEILVAFGGLAITLIFLTTFSLQNTVGAPLQEHIIQINLLRSLGASKKQVVWGTSFQITFLGALSSALGSFLVMAGLVFIPDLQSLEIGGMIIDPTFELIHLLFIIAVVSLSIMMASTRVVGSFIKNHRNNFQSL